MGNSECQDLGWKSNADFKDYFFFQGVKRQENVCK